MPWLSPGRCRPWSTRSCIVAVAGQRPALPKPPDSTCHDSAPVGVDLGPHAPAPSRMPPSGRHYQSRLIRHVMASPGRCRPWSTRSCIVAVAGQRPALPKPPDSTCHDSAPVGVDLGPHAPAPSRMPPSGRHYQSRLIRHVMASPGRCRPWSTRSCIVAVAGQRPALPKPPDSTCHDSAPVGVDLGRHALAPSWMPASGRHYPSRLIRHAMAQPR